MLLEEQAALRRVAVAVATESTAERVFDVVAEEVARGRSPVLTPVAQGPITQALAPALAPLALTLVRGLLSLGDGFVTVEVGRERRDGRPLEEAPERHVDPACIAQARQHL